MINRNWLASGLLTAVLLANAGAVPATGQEPRRSSGPQPEPVLRLTFEQRDGRLALVAAEDLTMVLPRPIKERTLAPGRGPSAFAYELRDDAGKTLLVQEADEPRVLVSETSDPEDRQRIERREAPAGDLTFSVLVPAPPRAATVEVTRPAARPQTAAGESAGRESLGSFPLANARRSPGGRP